MTHLNARVRLITMSHLSDCQEEASAERLNFVRHILEKFSNTDEEIDPAREWDIFKTSPNHEASKPKMAPRIDLMNVREAIFYILEVVEKLDIIVSSRPAVRRPFACSSLINFCKSLLILYPDLNTVVDPRKEWKIFQEHFLKTKVLTIHEVIEWRSLISTSKAQ